jgi:CHASE2 domain-containing sensor protein
VFLRGLGEDVRRDGDGLLFAAGLGVSGGLQDLRAVPVQRHRRGERAADLAHGGGALHAVVAEQAVRAAALSNRVPTEVLLLEIIGAAVALGLLGLHVGVLGRGMVAVLLAAAMVALLLYVSF